MDLGVFHGFQGLEVWRPVASCEPDIMPLKKVCNDPRLQYSRLVVLKAFSLGGLDWVGLTARWEIVMELDDCKDIR